LPVIDEKKWKLFDSEIRSFIKFQIILDKYALGWIATNQVLKALGYDLMNGERLDKVEASFLITASNPSS